MALAANKHTDANVALATTLTQITPGSGVRTVWFSCATACYLVFSDAHNEGDALPANRGFLIPANTAWPIPVGGKKILVAASSGTPTGHVYGEGD